MNARHVETSEKLMKVLRFLRERGENGATSRDIMEFCGTVAPGTVCSELRKNGYAVSCTFERVLEGGSKIYRYRLVG